jgi:hypothetical protein
VRSFFLHLPLKFLFLFEEQESHTLAVFCCITQRIGARKEEDKTLKISNSKNMSFLLQSLESGGFEFASLVTRFFEAKFSVPFVLEYDL